MQAKRHFDLQGLPEKTRSFIEDCLAEKSRLEDTFPIASALIDIAIDQVQTTGRIPGTELHADVFQQRPMKVAQRVYVPTKQFPRFNFTGKILGPKGNSLRRLQEKTMCKIAIKGRNSIHDRAAEDGLRESGNPRYAHLHKDLYVEISAVSTPAEAYARVAYGLAEIRQFLVPDKNDEVSQAQLHEIMSDPTMANAAKKAAPKFFASQKDRMQPKSILKRATNTTQTEYSRHYGAKQHEQEEKHEPEEQDPEDHKEVEHQEEFEEEKEDEPIPHTRGNSNSEQQEDKPLSKRPSPTVPNYIEPPKKRFRDAPSAPSKFLVYKYREIKKEK